MSFSYVAVSADAKTVEDALFALSPDFFIMEQRPQIDTFVQMYGYCQSRSGYLNGLHPNDVKAFCQHQGWCIIIDFSLSMPEDYRVLSTLSSQFGTVVTAMTRGTSDTAYFALFENGQLKRRIFSSNGTITAQGEPLAEEAAIKGDLFYVTELDILWQAQGLPPYLARLGGPYSAVHYLDNTEETVEKDIEEIAEKTRLYEELEAMKAQQRKTGNFATPVESAPAAAQGVHVGNVQSNALEQPSATGNEQPVASDDAQTVDKPINNESLSDDSLDDGDSINDDDSEEDEKAEKPKDKPWWKLW